MTKPVLLDYDLAAGVKAFSTTRKGGCSQGNYADFNINYYCGDKRECIEANRLSLCHLLGVEPDMLVYPHQVHGVEVREVDEAFLALDKHQRAEELEGVDAVMTRMTGVCIGVSTADCIPVLLYDMEHRAVCAIHSGWRGTVKRIVTKAVQAMEAGFGTRPAMLKAVIGPGISLEHFEVGNEVYDAFRIAGFDMEAVARSYGKWHIDLWEANRLLLVECGVCPDNIQTAGVCTYAHADQFFSARRLGIDSGRIFSGIMLEP
ncbi:MAG: peptidoglycan editing factor PgeF [Prevotella sp.]|nr:peptidoglycan editing factor PgeF [Prevotella sp.]